jgi:hypothetical protein
MKSAYFNHPIETVKSAVMLIAREYGKVSTSGNTITIEKGTTALSWKQIIYITLHVTPSNRVKVSVESTTPLQIISWGVNRDTEDEIIRKLKKLML